MHKQESAKINKFPVSLTAIRHWARIDILTCHWNHYYRAWNYRYVRSNKMYAAIIVAANYTWKLARPKSVKWNEISVHGWLFLWCYAVTWRHVDARRSLLDLSWYQSPTPWFGFPHNWSWMVSILLDVHIRYRWPGPPSSLRCPMLHVLLL